MHVATDDGTELVLLMSAGCLSPADGNSANVMESWGDGTRCLKLKGQMRYMPEWESIIFLGTPV